MINRKILSVLKLLLVLGLANGWLYLLYLYSGTISPDTETSQGEGATQENKETSGSIISFPTSIEDIQKYSVKLKAFSKESFVYVLLFFSSVYIYKQAFAIPGSFFMNLLSGTLFGVWKGFILCCLLTAFGATMCYLISKYITYELLQSLFPRKLASFGELVERNKDKLLYFLLSIRVFPMSPNWLINMACPIVRVPMRTFFMSVLLGLMPYNFVTVQAGSMLSEIKSVNDVMSFKTGLSLTCLALALLVPTLVKKRKRNQD